MSGVWRVALRRHLLLLQKKFPNIYIYQCVGCVQDLTISFHTDSKDKDLYFTATLAPSFTSLQTFDEIQTKDKPLLPISISSLNPSNTPDLLAKSVSTSVLTTLSVSTAPATKDGRASGSLVKDKHSSVSREADVFNPKSSSFAGDGRTSSLPTSLPLKDYTTVSSSASRDDKTASKNDKSINSYAFTDDKTLTLRTSSSSSDRKSLTSLATAVDKSDKLSKDKTAQPVEIVYSVTVPVAPSVTSESSVRLASPSQSRLSRTAPTRLTQTAELASSSLTLVSVGNGSPSEFYGYRIVPSPTQTPSKGVEYYSASVTPVYIPAMLGNAYGGGFVVTPSIYVSKQPYPNGPSEGVPPGYGSYSSLETQLNVSSAFSSFTAKKDETPSVGVLRLTQLPKDKFSTSSTAAGFTVYYITEEVLTTTTYCPLITISGKVITLTSTTLTSTFSTRSVVTQTQTVTQSTAVPSGSTTLLGLSSLRFQTTGLFEKTPVTVSGAPFLNSTFTIGPESKQNFSPKLEASGGSSRLTRIGNGIEGTNSIDVPVESNHAKSAAPLVSAQSLASLVGIFNGATINSNQSKLSESTAPSRAGIEITKSTASITRGNQVVASSISPPSVPELLSLLGSSEASISRNGTLVASLVSKLSVLLGSAITSKPTEAINTASLGPDTALLLDSEVSSLLSSLGGSISKQSANITLLSSGLSSLLGTLLANIPSSEVSAMSPNSGTISLPALSGVGVPSGVAVGLSSRPSGTTAAFAIASIASELSALLGSSSVPTGQNASISAPAAPLGSDITPGSALVNVASGSSQINDVPTASGAIVAASTGARKTEAAPESTFSASIVVGALSSSEASKLAAISRSAITAENLGEPSNSPEIETPTTDISNFIQQASATATPIPAATLNGINSDSEAPISTSTFIGETSPGIGSATLAPEAKGASVSPNEVFLGSSPTTSIASDEAEESASVPAISSATETALELFRPEGGSTSNIQGGELSGSSFVPSFESFEGYRSSLSSSPISVLAGQSTYSAVPEGSSHSAVAGGASSSIAQITSPAGPNLFTGMHASLSTSAAIDVAGRGNDSVSIVLSPTTVSPFLGAGTGLYKSFGLSLMALLATFFMLQ